LTFYSWLLVIGYREE
jgi:hypothetical protein